MAVTTTPLGFKKPDGNELARNGDNVIAANAQTAEELLQSARLRLDLIESGANASGVVADPDDPDALRISTGTKITTSPSDADALLITT